MNKLLVTFQKVEKHLKKGNKEILRKIFISTLHQFLQNFLYNQRDLTSKTSTMFCQNRPIVDSSHKLIDEG